MNASFAIALKFLAVAALIGALNACTAASDQVARVTQAELLIQTPAIERGGMHAPSHLPMLPSKGWMATTLPVVLRRPTLLDTLTNADVEAPWTTRWYRFRWQPPSPEATRFAIYIPRHHATVGVLSVYVNGVRIDNDERPGWNSPYFAFFPIAARNEPGTAQGFEIVVASSLVARGGGTLSTIFVGAADELQDRYRTRRFLQITAPLITSVSFVMLGAFALAFWWYRRTETAYALFAGIAAASFIRSLRYIYSDPLLLDGWFWWSVLNASGWILVFGHFLAARLNRRSYPRFERVIIAATMVTSVVTLLIPLGGILPHTIAPAVYVSQYFIGISVVAVMAHGAIKTRQREGILIVAVQILWFGASIHDGLLQNWGRDVEGIFLVPCGALLLLATFLYAILRRYLIAIQNAEVLNTSLESTLAQRTIQLESTHAKLRGIEREQAVSDERQRLMREMHDGLGSSLMSSLVLVEQGQLDSERVAQVLRESIDDLKLTIDSLEPIGNDLPTLLGTLRYRLGKRLESAGLKLEWKVDELPRLPWLNPTSALQVLRILQEALTNILRHARANTIRVETAAQAESVIVRISDDGCGFDIVATDKASAGRGLNNLRRRARSIGARIDITSTASGTAVTIELPRQQTTA